MRTERLPHPNPIAPSPVSGSGSAAPPARASSASARPGHVDVLQGAGIAFAQPALQLSAGRPVAGEPAGAWRVPERHELRAALDSDAVLRGALARESRDEAERWVGALQQALREHGDRLPPDRSGVELTLRFRAAYGSVHHIATGTLWRDPQDRLRIAFLHQESLPDVDATGRRPGTFTGRLYDGFDTRRDHPDGIAPVEESVKLAGLPDVNVRPIARPQALPEITRLLRERADRHVYAPSPGWPGVQAAAAGGRDLYATCFTIAELAHDALSGRPLAFPRDHDLGRTVRRLAPLTCIGPERFVTVGRPATPLHEAFRGTDARFQASAFMQLGTTWGQDCPWSVTGTRAVRALGLALEAGERLTDATGLRGEWHALKFAAPPQGLTLDGRPVLPGVTYLRADCERMQADAACRLRLDVAGPQAPPRSRL